MVSKIILSFVIVAVILFVYSFISFPVQKEIKYKYPDGFYCVPRQGITYFESNQVPVGAILVKSNPDITNGGYTKNLDMNFFKMMGCAK